MIYILNNQNVYLITHCVHIITAVNDCEIWWLFMSTYTASILFIVIRLVIIILRIDIFRLRSLSHGWRCALHAIEPVSLFSAILTLSRSRAQTALHRGRQSQYSPQILVDLWIMRVAWRELAVVMGGTWRSVGAEVSGRSDHFCPSVFWPSLRLRAKPLL